jgi:hypothetical protein
VRQEREDNVKINLTWAGKKLRRGRETTEAELTGTLFLLFFSSRLPLIIIHHYYYRASLLLQCPHAPLRLLLSPALLLLLLFLSRFQSPLLRHQRANVEQLNELHIEQPHFGASKAAILIENGCD